MRKVKEGSRTVTQACAGVRLSPGLGVGYAYRIERQAGVFYRLFISEAEVEAELLRLTHALEESRRQLEEIQKKFEAEVGPDHSYILQAHLLMLDDRQFLQEVEKRIRDSKQSPERAVREAAETWLSVYRTLNDPIFQERGSDLEEVVDRIIANLLELGPSDHSQLPEAIVLVAPVMSLSALAEFPLERIRGLVLAQGGQTSHAAIIARSHQIPMVGGIDFSDERIRTGDLLVVDGFEGVVHVNPDAEELSHFEKRGKQERDRHRLRSGDQEPCMTLDGVLVHLYANTEVGGEVQAGLQLGAEGIGLFRTEYVYMKYKEGLISEEEQFQVYRQLAQSVGELPAVVRTLDIGSEPHPYFSSLSGETDNVLGMRGIRLSLSFPEVLRAQVRAILRAGCFGNLKILLPMVTSADEIVEARKIIGEAAAELRESGESCDERIEVGTMLEVPAAVLALKSIAAVSDFLSVGTNDLIQYMLAAARSNERIASLCNPLHPAMLAALSQIASISEAMGKCAWVCGEMAAQPRFAFLLLGLGFRHLSMNPLFIPEVKMALRQVSSDDARQTATELLQSGSVEEIESQLDAHFSRLVSRTA